MMKVWVLEEYCSDSDSYDLVEVFENIGHAIVWVFDQNIPTKYVVEFDADEARLWKADYYVSKSNRTHRSMDKSDYLATLREVK
jgi:hypothetical protein